MSHLEDMLMTAEDLELVYASDDDTDDRMQDYMEETGLGELIERVNALFAEFIAEREDAYPEVRALDGLLGDTLPQILDEAVFDVFSGSRAYKEESARRSNAYDQYQLYPTYRLKTIESMVGQQHPEVLHEHNLNTGEYRAAKKAYLAGKNEPRLTQKQLKKVAEIENRYVTKSAEFIDLGRELWNQYRAEQGYDPDEFKDHDLFSHFFRSRGYIELVIRV